MSMASLYHQDLRSVLSCVIKEHVHSHINGIHLWGHVICCNFSTVVEEEAHTGGCIYILQLSQAPFQLVTNLLRRTTTAQSPP